MTKSELAVITVAMFAVSVYIVHMPREAVAQLLGIGV